MNERASALESVNMPTLLYEVGLVDEAVAYCGGETLDVPIAQAYALAASLGEANEPAGRRLFDLIGHHGFDDPTRGHVVGQEHDAALAWTRAAVQFRPHSAVLAAIQRLVEPHPDDEPRRRHETEESWWRYSRMMRVLIEESAQKGDEAALHLVESELESLAARLEESAAELDPQIATVMDLRVRTGAALLKSLGDAAKRETSLNDVDSTLRGKPIRAATALEFAELLARHGRVDRATELLDHIPYDEALTASRLSDTRGGDILDAEIPVLAVAFSSRSRARSRTRADTSGGGHTVRKRCSS